MAIPTDQTFFLGLVLIVVGTGLLKPNVSAIVGGLYPLGGAQRDAGFSVFYMGINTGALIGPLVCGFLGEKIDWHFGFAAAGVGMVLGLVQFRVTERYLGTKGVRPVQHPDPEIQRLQQRKRWAGLWIGTALLGLLVGSSLLGLLRIDPVAVAGSLGTTILVVASLYFLFMLTLGVKETRERKRVGAIVILFFFSAMFWSGFEQAGSSLNLFADRFTDRMLFGREMPASWLQSINPLFIILFAPVFGWGWVALAQRHLDPSSPGKFALGLGLLGLGFAVMLVASKIVVAGQKVLPTWLILTYLLHTFGELALSPVGLSTVTKLAPKTMVGQMMGVWFISTAFGNLIAGLVAGRFDPEQIQQMPDLFRAIVFFCLGAALVMLLLIKPMKRLMSGIR